ncbi:hypothetical protein HHI36_002656 [Cryptolaemus montrouzieri]|uniref:Uncharacterized protein n=1 Tax=Cryptolaemus montrouzieri TaxID=559131 RepID=A0ABD2PBP5_9CUCU
MRMIPVDQGSASESEYDISEQSENSDEYSASESEIYEWENAVISLRLLESRARGLLIARLRGISGCVWNSNLPERHSDRLSDVDPIYTPRPAGPAVNATTIASA